MQSKTTYGTLLAASAAAGVLLTAAPASAQTAADFVPDCASGVLAYSPGLTAGSVSNAAPTALETVVVNSGEGTFDPGSAVTATFNGVPVVPTPTVSSTGNASVPFTVPSVDPGTYAVIFTGTLNGRPNVVGVCLGVSAALAGGDGGPVAQPEPEPVPEGEPINDVVEQPVTLAPVAQRPSSLPFTGSVELLAVAGLGAGLVAAGAGTVVLARRRRQDLASA